MIHDADTLLVLANGLGIMALTAMGFGVLERTLSASPAVRTVLQGLLFGIGAIIAMLSPAQVMPGVIVDARSIFVGLAGAFGGVLAATVATLIASAARMMIGGFGAYAGICGILLAALAGLAWRKMYWTDGRQLHALLVLGFMIPTSLISFLLLPDGVGVNIIAKHGPAIAIASILAAVALGGFIEREVALVRRERILFKQASIDPLTGVLNRRSFEEQAQEALSVQGPCAILILDIDHFKAVNDKHGHGVGDDVIKQIAHIISRSTRYQDIVARTGGEEFAVFLRGVSAHQAREVAGRIRKSVETAKEGLPSVTVSIGLNWLSVPTELSAFFAAADAALYAAKNSGRNRVTFCSMAPPSLSTS